MKTAIILHGMPSKKEYFSPGGINQSKKHWLGWLQAELLRNGIQAQTPELSEPYEPDHKKWCATFDQFPIDKETMLIGHSCGAGFLVRWLSEHKIKVGRVALIAPWLDPSHILKSKMLNFDIDPNLPTRTAGITIFVSHDDFKDVLTSVATLKSAFKNEVMVEEFNGRGHFTHTDMGTDHFPELRDTLLRK